jgi:hypothetical protein
MRMTPSAISELTTSNAERRVFELLARSHISGDTEAAAFHSLNISQHDYKLVGELDFVLLSTRGVLILEVKGGGVECRDGIWHFTDRFGVDYRRSESPFQQARSGMFSLRERLQLRFGGGSVHHLAWGYGVVFPDTDFTTTSVEWDEPMVLDAGVLRGCRDLDGPLEALLSYWERKRGQRVPPTRTQIREVAQFLRPDFERLPSLRNRVDELDVAMEHLTDEQYLQLDLIDENPRILCAGGAGTGKTFLAVELAKRDAMSGARVLFLTSTSMLASFVRSRTGRAGVVVATGEAVPTGPYDSAIVDEGQDLLNLDDLATVDRELEGGLAHGRWRVFYDINRQSGLVGRFDPDALELLRSYGGVAARLSRNCRNTHEIVLQTKLLTAADLGTASAGHGPPVEYAPYDSREEQVSLIDRHLRDLQDDDIPPGDITILSPLPFRESAASATRAARKGHIIELSPAIAGSWPCQQMTFAQVADFKGLENRFVLLVDLDRIADEPRDINSMYVAMSRARAGLWVAMDQHVKAEAARLSKANLANVIGEAQLGDD